MAEKPCLFPARRATRVSDFFWTADSVTFDAEGAGAMTHAAYGYQLEQLVMVPIVLALVAFQAAQWLEIARRREIRRCRAAESRHKALANQAGVASRRGSVLSSAAGSAAGSAAASANVPPLKLRLHVVATACVAVFLVRVIDPTGAQGIFTVFWIHLFGNNVVAFVLAGTAYTFHFNICTVLSILVKSGRDHKRTRAFWAVFTRAVVFLSVVMANVPLLLRLWSDNAFLTDGIYLWWVAISVVLLLAELQHSIRLLKRARSDFSSSMTALNMSTAPLLRAASVKLFKTRMSMGLVAVLVVPLALVAGYNSLSQTLDEAYDDDYSEYEVRRGIFFFTQIAAVAIIQWYAALELSPDPHGPGIGGARGGSERSLSRSLSSGRGAGGRRSGGGGSGSGVGSGVSGGGAFGDDLDGDNDDYDDDGREPGSASQSGGGGGRGGVAALPGMSAMRGVYGSGDVSQLTMSSLNR